MPIEIADKIYLYQMEQKRRSEHDLILAHAVAVLSRTKKIPTVSRILQGQEGNKAKVLDEDEAKVAREFHEEMVQINLKR